MLSPHGLGMYSPTACTAVLLPQSRGLEVVRWLLNNIVYISWLWAANSNLTDTKSQRSQLGCVSLQHAVFSLVSGFELRSKHLPFLA